MAYEIIFKKRFTNKVVNLLGYLETEWGTKVSENFLKKMHKRFDTLSRQPYIGPFSKNQECERHFNYAAQ